MIFTLFIILLAAFWAFIGVMLAKWLRQAGHAKPFKGRNIDLYGGGNGYGRDKGLGAEEREVRFGGTGGRVVGMGYGEGRVKGL